MPLAASAQYAARQEDSAMRKKVQKPARDTRPVTQACLQRVRGGATAIEYGLIAAAHPDDINREPTQHPS
jgi:hypothetical protein